MAKIPIQTIREGSGLGQLSSEVLTLGERFSQVFIDEIERGA